MAQDAGPGPSGMPPLRSPSTRCSIIASGGWKFAYSLRNVAIVKPGYTRSSSRNDARAASFRPSMPLIAIGQMCGNDSRAIAGMPVDQIADAVEPNETQLAALSELGQASLTAAQNIRIACPSQAMLTAPGM